MVYRTIRYSSTSKERFRKEAKKVAKDWKIVKIKTNTRATKNRYGNYTAYLKEK